jgi:hypothetical protein
MCPWVGRGKPPRSRSVARYRPLRRRCYDCLGSQRASDLEVISGVPDRCERCGGITYLDHPAMLQKEHPMPLNHLLWRLAEGKSAPIQVGISCRCAWRYCPIQTLNFILRLDEPGGPKPEEARCPLCRRPMAVLSAKPLGSDAA